MFRVSDRSPLPGQRGNVSGAEAIRFSAAEISVTNSSPKLIRRSSYHSTALRSSARASGCSSIRTPSLEFLHDLRSDALPTSGLDATFSDITCATLEFLSPGRCDLLV